MTENELGTISIETKSLEVRMWESLRLARSTQVI